MNVASDRLQVVHPAGLAVGPQGLVNRLGHGHNTSMTIRVEALSATHHFPTLAWHRGLVRPDHKCSGRARLGVVRATTRVCS